MIRRQLLSLLQLRKRRRVSHLAGFTLCLFASMIVVDVVDDISPFFGQLVSVPVIIVLRRDRL
jgi:hypothetical protein